jgi:hypothetical protein
VVCDLSFILRNILETTAMRMILTTITTTKKETAMKKPNGM